MRKLRRLGPVSIFVAAVLAGPALAQQGMAYDPGDASPPSGSAPTILQNIGIDQKLDAQVPLDLKFRDEAGNPVTLAECGDGKPVVLALVYYKCPMLCNLVLNGLTKSLRAIKYDVGDKFNVVTVSFDPTETPELAAAKKANYLKTYNRLGAEKGWRFLTGDAASINALTSAVGFRYTWDDKSSQFAHASAIMVLTPRGRISRYLYGVEYSARDLQFSLMDAAGEKIGGPVEQLLLYCFHYDPATGKYGLVIMRVMRIAGILTVGLLTAFVGVMLYRDRKKKRAAAAVPATAGSNTGSAPGLSH